MTLDWNLLESPPGFKVETQLDQHINILILALHVVIFIPFGITFL